MLAQRKAAASAELAANPRYQMYEFRSGILPDARDVVVYLPAEYLVDEGRRFPVFYLHDGQNLFDGLTSFIADKTWRAHTTADELAVAGEIEPMILVGIANTGLRRMAEYTPTRDFKMGGGEGSSYGRLLMEELKPFVDGAYRTRTGAEDFSPFCAGCIAVLAVEETALGGFNEKFIWRIAVRRQIRIKFSEAHL